MITIIITSSYFTTPTRLGLARVLVATLLSDQLHVPVAILALSKHVSPPFAALELISAIFAFQIDHSSRCQTQDLSPFATNVKTEARYFYLERKGHLPSARFSETSEVFSKHIDDHRCYSSSDLRSRCRLDYYFYQFGSHAQKFSV